MNVVFMEEVGGPARVGEIKNVAAGFARNYLLPRRLAAPATDHYIAIAQARAEKEARRQDRPDDEARVHLLPTLEGRAAPPPAPGETRRGRPGLGWKQRGGAPPQPIRDLGVHEVMVKLTRNVHMPVTVNVEPLGGMPEGAAAEAEAGAEEAAEEEAEAEAEAVAEEAAEEEPAAEEPEEE